MSSEEAKPIDVPVADKCCFCIELKLGVLIICALEMIWSGLVLLSLIGSVLFGGAILGYPSYWPFWMLLVSFLITALAFGLALWCFLDAYNARPDGIRVFWIYKLVTVVLEVLFFVIGGWWGLGEFFSMIIHACISLYFIWCVYSLHQALEKGGEAATEAGFTKDDAMSKMPLIGDNKA